jgi:hypothetical protein
MRNPLSILAASILVTACGGSDKNTTNTGDTAGKQASAIEYKVGDAVDVLYAGSYYPGTVVSYNKSDDCYEIKYDDPNSNNSCKGVDRLKPRGKSFAEPFTNNPEDAFGTWNTSTVTQTSSETSTHVTTETHGYSHGTITINPDHTWSWQPTSTEKLEGKWDLNPSPSQYKGPIHIIKGLSDKDWFVGYFGKDDQGKPSIYIAGEDGTRWWGGR